MESQKTLNCQSNPEKGEQNQRYCNFLISNYITAYSNQNNMVLYQYKNRHTEQWNIIKSTEIHPCLYGQLIFNKEGKTKQWGKDTESLINGVGKSGQLYAKE